MGKSLLELFYKKDVKQLYQLENNAAAKGKTLSSKYDIRNSKTRQPVYSASPLMRVPMFLLHKIRLTGSERKSENLIENEVAGLRSLRGLASPIIYGSEIIRLKLQSTPTVERMKNAQGGVLPGVTAFGQAIKKTREAVNTFFGLADYPIPTTISYKLDQLGTKDPTYDRMIKLGELKNNFVSSFLAKVLRDSAGGASTIPRQVVGNAVAAAKAGLRNKITGEAQKSSNGALAVKEFKVGDQTSVILYSEYGKYSNAGKPGEVTVGKAARNLEGDESPQRSIRFQYKNRIKLNPAYPSITATGNTASPYSRDWYNAKLDNFDLGASPDNAVKYKYNSDNKFTPDNSYTANDFGLFRGKANPDIDNDRENLDKLDWRKDSRLKNYYEYQQFKQSLRATYATNQSNYFAGYGVAFKANTFGIGTSDDENYPLYDKPGVLYPDSRNNGYIQKFYPPQGAEDQDKDVYTKNTASPATNWNTATNQLETQDYATSVGGVRYGTKFFRDSGDVIVPTKDGQKTINVNSLRPQKLPSPESPNTGKYSFENQVKNTVNGPLSDTLERRRGLGTKRDVLNQTGRFTNEELNQVRYEGRTIDDVDLITMKFQRMNDMSAIILRTTITGFSETFTPGWEGNQFLGNPFKFYSYTGVERKVSLTVKFYAMSQIELVMMWRRLEYLAHFTYPYGYSDSGTIPSLFYFTLGSMYVKKPGILTSLTYNIDDNQQLWEIGGTGKAKVSFDTEKNEHRYVPAFDGVFYRDLRFKEDTLRITDVEQAYPDNPAGNQSVVDISSINIDEYKLPKFVNAQLEITFLEAPADTATNVYGFGKPAARGSNFGSTPGSYATLGAGNGKAFDSEGFKAATEERAKQIATEQLNKEKKKKDSEDAYRKKEADAAKRNSTTSTYLGMGVYTRG